MMFAYFESRIGNEENDGSTANLTVGDGREEEDGGRKRTKERLSGS
jgi:hypothetical protein